VKFSELVKTLRVQPDLSAEFWGNGDELNPKIREALLRVAESFYKWIKLEKKPKVRDIVLTGSLANYNYSNISDIDLHILVDYEDMESEKAVIEEFFMLAKAKWNEEHDIAIKGHEVEVYVEEVNSPHVSTGLYSVLHNRWIKKPSKESPIYDEQDVLSKAKYFAIVYNDLVKQYKSNEDSLDIYKTVVLLRDKIRLFRQGGLSTGGVYSTENMAFKLMRRSGLLDKLKDFQNRLFDEILSVESVYADTE